METPFLSPHPQVDVAFVHTSGRRRPRRRARVCVWGGLQGGFARPEINSGFCGDIYDRWDGGADNKPLVQMGKNMGNGMVLAMSAWYVTPPPPNGVVIVAGSSFDIVQ